MAGHRVDSRAGGRISRGLSPKSEVNLSIVWLQASESMPQSSAAFRIASRIFVFSPGPLTISKKFGQMLNHLGQSPLDDPQLDARSSKRWRSEPKSNS